MPSPSKSHRKGGQKGRLWEKSTSFHGRGSGVLADTLPKPRTVPDLLSGSRGGGLSAATPLKLTKLLLNVTIWRSVGPERVLMPPEATVEDLIAAALRQYVKHSRRPVLGSTDAAHFDLHYSQFSLESLDKKEKVMELGSRNFFLCPKQEAPLPVPVGSCSCSKEVDPLVKKWLPLPLPNFMNFLR